VLDQSRYLLDMSLIATLPFIIIIINNTQYDSEEEKENKK